jgi:predicted nucleic acid-binding protein
LTPDTSVIVAAFASWHPAHADCVAAIREVDTLVAHAELEAYSVLTRLPPPHRVPSATAAEYLRRQFSGDRLVLDDTNRRRLVTRLSESGIAGGATYDALIAITANEHDLTLLTRDARAGATYRATGARFRHV